MYLLKIQKKSDSVEQISLSLRNNYKEFEKMGELIEYLFKNAVYIESYQIFTINELKIDDSEFGSNINMNSKGINMASSESLCKFD